jgi:hypothetical protein
LNLAASDAQGKGYPVGQLLRAIIGGDIEGHGAADKPF